MKIKLKSGKEVYLEAFHCTPTYSGLLAGVPSIESNETLIKNLSYPIEWGYRVSVLKKSDSYASENVLKPIIYSVWLSSHESIKKSDTNVDGTELILMWFGDELLDKSIKEIIVNGVGTILWNELAHNFSI